MSSWAILLVSASCSSGATLASAMYSKWVSRASLTRWFFMSLSNNERRRGTIPILEHGAYAPTIVTFEFAKRAVSTLPSLLTSSCSLSVASPKPNEMLVGATREIIITP